MWRHAGRWAPDLCGQAGGGRPAGSLRRLQKRPAKKVTPTSLPPDPPSPSLFPCQVPPFRVPTPSLAVPQPARAPTPPAATAPGHAAPPPLVPPRSLTPAASPTSLDRSSAGGPAAEFDAKHLKFVRDAGKGSFARVSICEFCPPRAPSPAGGGPPSLDDAASAASGSLAGGSTALTSSRVAVKVLAPGQGPVAAASLIAEGALMAALDHPNIVPCYGGGVGGGGSSHGGNTAAAALKASGAKGAPFIVQACVDGGTLRDRVIDQMSKRGRAYTAAAARAWSADVAAGLAYLHTRSPPLIHRDLKLENILLTREPGPSGHATALIADFGLARHVSELGDAVGGDGSTTGAASDDSALAAELALMRRVRNLDPTACTGSFLYMAPEVMKGERYGCAADVFSLGVLMSELFSGVITSTVVVGPTFNAGAAQAHAARVAAGYRRPLPVGLAPSIKTIIEACWAADPASRPSAADVALALGAAAPDVDDDDTVQPGCAACVVM